MIEVIVNVRDAVFAALVAWTGVGDAEGPKPAKDQVAPASKTCLLYTSDAADERSSVDLGGRRIIKKKKQRKPREEIYIMCTGHISSSRRHTL